MRRPLIAFLLAATALAPAAAEAKDKGGRGDRGPKAEQRQDRAEHRREARQDRRAERQDRSFARQDRRVERRDRQVERQDRRAERREVQLVRRERKRERNWDRADRKREARSDRVVRAAVRERVRDRRDDRRFARARQRDARDRYAVVRRYSYRDAPVRTYRAGPRWTYARYQPTYWPGYAPSDAYYGDDYDYGRFGYTGHGPTYADYGYGYDQPGLFSGGGLVTLLLPVLLQAVAGGGFDLGGLGGLTTLAGGGSMLGDNGFGYDDFSYGAAPQFDYADAYYDGEPYRYDDPYLYEPAYASGPFGYDDALSSGGDLMTDGLAGLVIPALLGGQTGLI